MWGLPDPFPATHDHHGVILILAVAETGALFVCDDGRLQFDEFHHIRVDWHFNWNTHTWEDEAIGEVDDEAGDGGPEISGDLPIVDGTDGSDPSDQGHGAAGSVDSE